MKKDIFQIVVRILIVVYVAYVIYFVLSFVNSIDMLREIGNTTNEILKVTKNSIILSMIIEVLGLLIMPFTIYCVHTIGKNHREVDNLKRLLIREQIIKKSQEDQKKQEVKLKECEVCNRVISENDLICPHCKSILKLEGKEFEELIENEVIEFCEECGYQLFKDDIDCPNCGKERKRD